MSGATSGLRATCWKTAPAIPSAAPASSAVSTRGSRSSSTMKSTAGSPAPASEETTSSGGTGNSPIAIPATSAASAAAVSAAVDGEHPAVGAEGDAPGADDDHSATVRRRRTSQMKNGAPNSAVTIPTSSSAGCTSNRPATSPASSRLAPSTML